MKEAIKSAAALSAIVLAVCLEGIVSQFGPGGWCAVIVIMLFIYAAATA